MTAPVLEQIAKEFAEANKLNEVNFKGKGNFKETYRAMTPEGEDVALKLLIPHKYSLERSEREIQAMMKCHSPLIAKLYNHGSFIANDGKSYHFCIEEYMDGGSLAEQIVSETLEPNTIRQYTISLVEAINYLKNMNLVHRDIKPENIMFRNSSDIPVLVDLGLARDLSESSLTPTWLPHGPGTPYYSAPEQLNNEKHLINWRTDQFSLGVTISICLVGIHPFSETGMTQGDIVTAVANRKLCTSSFIKKAADLGFGFVIKMLDPWPHRRYQTPAKLINDIRS